MREAQNSRLGTALFASLGTAALVASGFEWIAASNELAAAQAATSDHSAQLAAGREEERLLVAIAEQPSEGDVASVVRAVRKASGARSVRILTSRSQPFIQYEHFAELPTELAAEGEFGALVGLLDDLQRAGENLLVRRAEFRRAPEANAVSLDCVVSLIVSRRGVARRESH